jgi:hypothetical protein
LFANICKTNGKGLTVRYIVQLCWSHLFTFTFYHGAMNWNPEHTYMHFHFRDPLESLGYRVYHKYSIGKPSYSIHVPNNSNSVYSVKPMVGIVDPKNYRRADVNCSGSCKFILINNSYRDNLNTYLPSFINIAVLTFMYFHSFWCFIALKTKKISFQ